MLLLTKTSFVKVKFFSQDWPLCLTHCYLFIKTKTQMLASDVFNQLMVTFYWKRVTTHM